MRSPVIVLALLAGALLNLDDSRQALGQDNKLDYPKEAFGFSGTLSAQVVKAPDKVYGWFEIKVVKVMSFAPSNKTKIRNTKALTEAWKDKCVAVLGVKGMAELKVGDMVTVTAANKEVHLRATKVAKDEPGEAKPDSEAKPAEKEKKDDARAEAYLKYAKKLLDQGMIEKAKERLKEIVERFPESKAGEEAKKSLEKLAKDAGPDTRHEPGKP
jgi:hypothetical protein